MKKVKVRITDPNSFCRQFPDGEVIGGSWGDPIVATLLLNDNEFKGLMLFMGNYSDLRHDLALYDFIHSICITEWHKRVLLHNFKELPENIKIEII